MKDWLRGLLGGKGKDAGKRPARPPSGPASDRIERLLDHHARTGLWTELAIRLDRLQRDGLRDGEEPVWYRVRARADAERGRLDDALQLIEEAREVHPDDVTLISAQAALHALRGEPEPMLACDRAVPYPIVKAAEALAQVRRAALWGAHRDGLAALEPVLQSLYELETAAPGVVAAHALPPLATTVRLGAALHVALDEGDAARALIREANVRVEDFEGAPLLQELDALEGRDSGPLRAADERAADEADRRARPAAEFQLRAAILDARKDGDTERLDAVEITTLDPPWLADVRALAREDAAHASGDAAAAAGMRATLVDAIESSLTPDHAFRFLLVDAWERLAAAHRETVRGRFGESPASEEPVADDDGDEETPTGEVAGG